MSLPSGVKYLVIGAGIHGLSTAWHLAKEQRAAGQEPDVLVVDKTGVGAGASGIACGVVRNNYFQPAMSELMAANVEVWEQDPAAFSLPPGRLHGPRSGASDRRPDSGARAPGADRLPVRPDRRRAGGARLHAAPLPRLARAGRARLPARAPRRVREQHGVAPRPGCEGARGRGADRRRRPRDRVRVRCQRCGDVGADRPGLGCSRAGDRRRRPVGRDDLGHARPAAAPGRAHADWRCARRPADVDVLVPAGGRDRRRSQPAVPGGRHHAAGHPCRLRCSAV